MRCIIISLCFKFDLPKPKELINQIPLRFLPEYMPVLDKETKEQLIQALITRHKNKIKRSLTRQSRVKDTSCKPSQAAQVRGHIAAALLLDFQNYNHFEEKVEKGYRELFK